MAVAVSSLDYPLMTVDGYQTYQLAQIATFLAEALARHSSSRAGRAGQAARGAAVRDLASGARALARATNRPLATVMLPRPLDMAGFDQASALVGPPARYADVVSIGGGDFAVVGHIPGIGRVGARVGTHNVALALRKSFLSKPVEELAVWAVQTTPVRVPTMPRTVDLAAFVEQLDPRAPTHCAVAAALRGADRRTDLAIAGRFRGIDLNLPVGFRPLSAPSGPAAPGQRPRAPRRANGGPRPGPVPAGSRLPRSPG